jgi:hypothetical protein
MVSGIRRRMLAGTHSRAAASDNDTQKPKKPPAQAAVGWQFHLSGTLSGMRRAARHPANDNRDTRLLGWISYAQT